MPTPIITVKNLVKKYGNFTAVNGISFEIAHLRAKIRLR